MKHYDLKKTLFFFSIFCVFFFLVLFWQQSSTIDEPKIFQIRGESEVHTHKKAYPPDPQWTWICVNERCERQAIKSKIPAVSLTTCSMLCGSTQLWPQPTGPVTLGSRSATFDHRQLHFETHVKEPAEKLLKQAISIFNENVLSYVQNFNYTQNRPEIKKFLVVVFIQDSSVDKLKLKTDEGYRLVVKTKDDELVANLTARTYFGVRHGLETLSQLIWWDEYTNRGNLRVLKIASVVDSPIFPYRGLMVDTARNFMTVESLERVLIGMSANKLNVFHWHVSDSQSFPLILPKLPQLAKTGAYGSDMMYSPKEVRHLVNFARVRGIRILIEIDTPAHAGNGWTWGPSEGLGELAICVNQKPWSLFCGEPPCGQLNPDNPKVYEVLEKLYSDLLELTGENELFHIGGDEVNLECWAQSLSGVTVKKYIDLHELWGEFTLKALNSLERANGGKPIPHVLVWSSNLSKRPYINRYFNKTNIVVQSWGASQWPDSTDLIADGYQIIISHVDAWYLDCGFGRWRETGEATCDPYKPWQTVYNHRPWFQPGVKKNQVMGGEICLWTEQVDESSLDSRLWPRAAAFAERVWSDPSVDLPSYSSIQEDVYTRLNSHRNRLVMRGLRAEALWPLWCLQNPGQCL